ncbi:MAG: hypothetical protein ACKOCD_08450 [Nitrospiraceae bacterium]
MAVPWTDEVFYADPGVGLAIGEGFRSSDWSVWGQSAVWGLSNPGVGLLLAGWCKLFGVAAWSVHLFFVISYAAGWWLLSGWIKQWGNLPESSRALLMAYGLASHAMSGNAMHHARPDAFWPLLFWLFLSASFGSGTNLRNATRIFPLGLLSVFMGLQFCAFFSLAGACVWIWKRNTESFILGAVQALGIAFGLAVLFACYSAHGVWDDFMSHRISSTGMPIELRFWFISPDLYVLTPALLVLAVQGKNRPSSGGLFWPPALVLVSVPLIMHLIGRYQAQYVWMAVAPSMLLALFATRPSPARLCALSAICLFLTMLGLAGKIRDLAKSTADIFLRAGAVAALYESAAIDSGPVLVSVPLYYDVRRAGYQVTVAFDYRVPPRQELNYKVRWALLSEADVPLVIPQLPGMWTEVRRLPAKDFAPSHGGFVLLNRIP